MALDITSQSLFMLLSLKSLPVQLFQVFARQHSILAPISSCFSSIGIAFCIAYFLPKKDPLESTLFTNSNIVDQAGTQRPGYLW
jgi:hypothetical protein